MKAKHFLTLFALLGSVMANAQSTITAVEDAVVKVVVHKVPKNILGGSQNPVEVFNKSGKEIKSVTIDVTCDCDDGADATMKGYFTNIKPFDSKKDIVSFIDCNKGLVQNCRGSITQIKMDEVELPGDKTTNAGSFYKNANLNVSLRNQDGVGIYIDVQNISNKEIYEYEINTECDCQYKNGSTNKINRVLHFKGEYAYKPIKSGGTNFGTGQPLECGSLGKITGCRVTSVSKFRFVEKEKEEAKNGSFTDTRGGQTYKVINVKHVQSGNTTTWMAQNLNYKMPGSYAFDNNEGNRGRYGLLYTWDAAKKACPSGWHLPTDNEWDLLVNEFGGGYDAFKALNSEGSSGFGALPAGFRYPDGDYVDSGRYGLWWSSSPAGADEAWGWYLDGGDSEVDRISSPVSNGYSVRCVRD